MAKGNAVNEENTGLWNAVDYLNDLFT